MNEFIYPYLANVALNHNSSGFPQFTTITLHSGATKKMNIKITKRPIEQKKQHCYIPHQIESPKVDNN